MTREKAIEILKQRECCRECVVDIGDCNDCDKAFEMAIKALEQEPCEDAVSRQAALGALNCEISGSIESDIGLSKYKREFQEFANMILNAQEKAIQALPSVTPTPKWIPVSENLPEEETRVMICTVNGKIDIADHRLQEWTDDDWEWFVCGTLGYKRTYCDNEVVAWMPLPEPYKADMRGGDQ